MALNFGTGSMFTQTDVRETQTDVEGVKTGRYIQHGAITIVDNVIQQDITIEEVNTDNSFVICNGMSNDAVKLELINSTTIRVYRPYEYLDSTTVYWTVIQEATGEIKSRQLGHGSESIIPVDTTRSVVYCQGASSAETSGDGPGGIRLNLSSSSTVTATAENGTPYFIVVEYN